MIAKTIRRLFSSPPKIRTAEEQRIELKKAQIRLEAKRLAREKKKNQVEEELIHQLVLEFAKSMGCAISHGHGKMNVMLNQGFGTRLMLQFVKELESRGYAVSGAYNDHSIPATGLRVETDGKRMTGSSWYESKSTANRSVVRGPTVGSTHYADAEYCNYIVSL